MGEQKMGAWMVRFFFVCLGLWGPLCGAVDLTDISVEKKTTLPQETRVIFSFNGAAPDERDMLLEGQEATATEPKIVLDFSGTTLGKTEGLQKMKQKDPLIASLYNVGFSENGIAKVRSIVTLKKNVLYRLIREEQRIILAIRLVGWGGVFSDPLVHAGTVQGVTFKRGGQGEGIVTIQLSDPRMLVNFSDTPQRIVVRFQKADLASGLERRMDVVDFATPVYAIETRAVGDRKEGETVEVTIVTQGETDTMAYQTDREYTINIREKSQSAMVLLDQENFTGEPISLNFQNIEVRSVLQILAEFTGLNVVASDAIRGHVTLRLRHVPWDQALSIILKTQGLAKRRSGDVLLIGPMDEIALQEKQELEISQQLRTLVPLYSEFIQINYAKAQDIADLLKGLVGGGDALQAMLSSRGSVALDVRTNTLLVQETAEKLAEIRALVKRLDVPVRQVLIESRIVEATDSFQKALGVQFGTAARTSIKTHPQVGVASTLTGSESMVIDGIHPKGLTLSDRLQVTLPNSILGGVGQLAMTIGRLPGGTILDLELSALENEKLGKVISSPRLVTADQQKAVIESGEELPYLESSSSGAATIAFKKAVLRLEVVPRITPNDRILLDLVVNQDAKGEVIGNVPAINTNKIQTSVLVENGQTIVLGGVYKQTTSNQETRVPYLGKIPGLGWLFRSSGKQNDRKELMIFVTPKIVSEDAD
jgi:type IV pilus assembly protein PilQ